MVTIARIIVSGLLDLSNPIIETTIGKFLILVGLCLVDSGQWNLVGLEEESFTKESLQESGNLKEPLHNIMGVGLKKQRGLLSMQIV